MEVSFTPSSQLASLDTDLGASSRTSPLASMTHRYEHFVRPQLGRLLELFKMDLQYSTAEGDTIWAEPKSPGADPIPITDFLGGYGSTLLGHNPPQLRDVACEFIQGRGVIHAQISVRAQTVLLAEKLNQILGETFKTEEKFLLTLTNTGAEAVEAALKHALSAWNQKRDQLIFRLRSAAIQANANPQITSFFQAKIIELQNLEPLLWAMRKSFHGKTAGSVLATDNPVFRGMYSRNLYDVEFISDADDAAALVAQADWKLEVPPALNAFAAAFGESLPQLSRAIGFIFEPIQGEGGVVEISPEFIKAMQHELQPRGVPILVDEIQSGLYRTGEFLAVQTSGVTPDYILLGKGLGGAITKIGAVLISEKYYLDEFSWIHSSTFAEDDLSSKVALSTIEILHATVDETRVKAEIFERAIRRLVAEIQVEHPGVIERVRGRGFFLGIEFNFNENSPIPDLLWGLAEQGFATYLLASYLLNRNQLRLGVTLSAPNILRLEPSRDISGDAVTQLANGLRDVVIKIRNCEMSALISHLFDMPASESVLSRRAPARKKISPHVIGATNVAFLAHMVDHRETRKMDPLFAIQSAGTLTHLFDNLQSRVHPYRLHRQFIKGNGDRDVNLSMYSMMLSSAWFEKQIRAQSPKALAVVQEAADMAISDGAEYIGLGQFTSIATQNGLLLKVPSHVKVTTGNSLTAGMAIRAAMRSLEAKDKNLSESHIGIVGFTGNICQAIAQIFVSQCHEMTLMHRESLEQSPKFAKAAKALINSNLSKNPNHFHFIHEASGLVNCDVVVIGTNSTKSFIEMEHLKEDAVILDISVPSNVSEDVKKDSRKSYFVGGMTTLPGEPELDHPWNFTRGTPFFYACMAETVMMGLEGMQMSLSLGGLSRDTILESLARADAAGISLGAARKF